MLPRHVQLSSLTSLHPWLATVGFSQYSSGGSILFDIPNVHADSYSGVDHRYPPDHGRKTIVVVVILQSKR